MFKLFSLGNLYISTFVEKKGENIGRAPLELVWCEKCTLVQLRHTAPQELLYSGRYWYESGLNKVIVDDLKDIIKRSLKYHKTGTWIDVGANDGSLLKYVPKSFMRIGVEPANNLQKKLRVNSDGVIKKFWEDVNFPIKASVITAIGMFYDSDDPNKFIANVKKHLADKGLFVAQMMTAKSMLEKNDVGNICHEHLEYYSYKSLKYLFEKNGLEIFKIEENNINGGSYRIFARHYRVGSINYIEKITKKDYKDFYKRICENKKWVTNYIKKCISYGEQIYAYGASTKGNTILQWYKLTSKEIKGIAEIHSNKIKKFTVGTNIPICLERQADSLADWYLVLPYAFREGFIKNKLSWLNKGGRFIFCTPKFEIYPN